MVAPTLLTVASSVFTTGAILLAQRQAGQAAEVEAKYRQDLLARQAESDRNDLRENTSRRLSERERHMAELRVMNAARGMANSGTQLAVMGEIESRLDDHRWCVHRCSCSF